MDNKINDNDTEAIETESNNAEKVSTRSEHSHRDGHYYSSHHSRRHHHDRRHKRSGIFGKKGKINVDKKLTLILSAVVLTVLIVLGIWFDSPSINNNYKKGTNNKLTNQEAKNNIVTWDKPIYDANIPVFQLSEEKPAKNTKHTSDDIYAMYDALMAKYPQYITKTDMGLCSDGVNHVYRYDFREASPYVDVSGRHEWSETKSKAIIISGIHWEWGGIFALYYALEEIAGNPDLKDFRRNTHLIVLPVSNPYGVEHQSVRNANQVEIHRNFEIDFIYPGEDGYIEVGQRSHGGTSPLSEIETQYIDGLLKENTDAAFFLSCHSFQQDTDWGTGFIWHSPATYYMCNMGYRVIDKLSNAWIAKYGEILYTGTKEYKTPRLQDGDICLGFGRLSTTNGTETKQAMKYGIQGINLEICDTFWVHGTKEKPEKALSSFTLSRGAEVYVNFLLTAFGVYDPTDKLLQGTVR